MPASRGSRSCFAGISASSKYDGVASSNISVVSKGLRPNRFLRQHALPNDIGNSNSRHVSQKRRHEWYHKMLTQKVAKETAVEYVQTPSAERVCTRFTSGTPAPAQRSSGKVDVAPSYRRPRSVTVNSTAVRRAAYRSAREYRSMATRQHDAGNTENASNTEGRNIVPQVR